jgi:imidazolonepropionase-like amidohydrolase
MTTIHAGALFDGFTLTGPATIRVEHGTIVELDRAGRIPPSEFTDDFGPDACLLPGLIDTHVHLSFDASPNPVTSLEGLSDTDLLAAMRTAARTALSAGVTTVRDLGDRNYSALRLADEFKAHPERGPHILAAGPPITTIGGHCFFLGGEAEGSQALLNAVRERHARGCAVIKVMVSGGNMTPGSAPDQSQYGVEDVRVIVNEAHRLGLPVAAHAHGTGAIKDALEAGVDSIEHVTFWATDADDAPDENLLKALSNSEVAVSLTVGDDFTAASFDPPAAILRRFATIKQAYAALVEQGAHVVIGSDAGVAPHKHHAVLPHGVIQLAELGADPLTALTAATSTAAKVVGLQDRKGRLAEGWDADLLVLPGNPVDDLSHLLDPQAVYRAGTRIR